MNIRLERKLIEEFVAKKKRARYIAFIERESSRKTFLDELYHFKDFDWNLFEEIRGNQNERDAIRQTLIDKKNISSCYVISTNKTFDGKPFTVSDGIDQIVGVEGTIIIFGETEVVYYEGEAPHNRFISK